MKKSNKILAVLLALVMALVAVPTAMAEEVHEHTYVQQGEGTAATCTEDGKAISKCECGDEIEVITETKKGHAWDEGTVTTEATCTEAGVKTYTCTVCGETKTEEIPAAHKFDVFVEKNAETHTYQCSVCNKDNVAEAHAWDEGTVTKETTCKEAGVKEFKCACGEIKTEEIPMLAEHSWNEGAVTKNETCTDAGVKTYTCLVCGETKNEDIPAAHKFDDVIGKDAETHTCQCSVCGKDNTAEAHTWDEGAVTTEPICDKAGVKTYTCTVCGETKTEEVPAAHKFDTLVEKDDETHTYQCSVCGKDNVAEAHTWDEGTVTKEATCKEAGEKEVKCACGQTKTVEIPVLEEHTWDEGEVTEEPGCGVTGVKTYTCTVCEETKTEEIPAVSEHNWDEWIIIIDPTTEATGLEARTCQNCFEVELREIEKLEEEILLGDVDGNGEVQAIDARYVLQHVAGLITLTEEQQKAADMNGDGEVKAIDARYILQAVAGITE